jgi:hypothetical protein
VRYVRHDALDAVALAAMRPADVVVVAGLYEILLDEAAIRASLRAIHTSMPREGLLVLTGQPHHPQLATIGRLLTHRDGTPWQMHLRSTATLEAWCRAAGFVDVQTHGDTRGMFSISIARAGHGLQGVTNLEPGQTFDRLVPVNLQLAYPGA